MMLPRFINRFAALSGLMLLLVGGLGLAPSPGYTQGQTSTTTDAGLPDYNLWEKLAQRAETALQDQRASDSAFEGLRRELVLWRSTFEQGQGVNRARIETLKNQINALGPEPEGESTEDNTLTQRRVELNAQLAALEAPKRHALAAYTRADGLIAEADRIIRDRQAARLFELQPSPVLPTLWPGAMHEISASFAAAKAEVQAAWRSDALQTNLRRNAAKTLFYLLVSIVLLWRGRDWMVRLTARIQGHATGASGGAWGFLVSLAQIILPGIGIYAFAEALFSTGLLGFRGQLIADGLIPIGMGFFIGRWLMLRLLPRRSGRQTFLDMAEPAAEKLRRTAGGLGILWGLERLLKQLALFEGFTSESLVVLQFPIILISGILMVRFGRLLRQSLVAPTDQPEASGLFRYRSIDLSGRALIAIGLIGPILAAVGYSAGAAAILFPAVLSLALLALLVVLSGVMRDVYALLAHHDDETARDALIPILMSFVLVLLSLPIFALIWGARFADLSEIWSRFLAGYQLGETRISPTDFLTFAVVFVVGYMATRLLQSTMRNSVLPKTRIDPGGKTAIVSGLGYVGIFLAAVIAISTAGIDLSSLAIVAGALSVGIGFGLQNIVSNFVAGIILLIERPVAEGDWIEVNGYSGTVREISVRSTRIATFDRTEVIIPNSDLVSGAVTNYTRGNLVGRAVIKVGVAYGTDTHVVEKILHDIAAAHPMVAKNPEPAVHFINFGADSMDFEIRAILRDVNFILRVTSDINHEIVRRFAEENIEIPFAQRDLWLRNPESLAATKARRKSTTRGKAK